MQTNTMTLPNTYYATGILATVSYIIANKQRTVHDQNKN